MIFFRYLFNEKIKKCIITPIFQQVIMSIIEFVIVLIGSLMLKTDTSLVELIIGSVVSIIISFIIHFFVFSVDYSRTEHTQFEDDEYYYYVKAVPKITVSTPNKKVKKINSKKSPAPRTAQAPTSVKTAHGVTRTTAGTSRVEERSKEGVKKKIKD